MSQEQFSPFLDFLNLCGGKKYNDFFQVSVDINVSNANIVYFVYICSFGKGLKRLKKARKRPKVVLRHEICNCIMVFVSKRGETKTKKVLLPRGYQLQPVHSGHYSQYCGNLYVAFFRLLEFCVVLPLVTFRESLHAPNTFST